MVARKLGHSRPYRNKKVDRILTTYNPRPEYRVQVRRVMRQLGPPMYASAAYENAIYAKPSRSSFR